MSGIDHDAPYAALATRLQTYCGSLLAQPVTRKLWAWDSLGDTQQPSIVVVATTQTPRLDGVNLPVWTLGAAILVYVRCDADPGSSGEPKLNAILTSIEAALYRQNDAYDVTSPGQRCQNFTTLGGVVYQAIPGPVEIEHGQDGKQSVAMMTISMVLAAR